MFYIATPYIVFKYANICCYHKYVQYLLISAWLWNSKKGGSLKATFLVKNRYTQRKPLYFENTGSASSSKIGHDFKKWSGSKIEVRKKCFFYKKWSPKLIFIRIFFWKNSVDFYIENWLWKYDFGTFLQTITHHRIVF